MITLIRNIEAFFGEVHNKKRNYIRFTGMILLGQRRGIRISKTKHVKHIDLAKLNWNFRKHKTALWANYF